jgi:ketosteroid isomerase-like protein
MNAAESKKLVLDFLEEASSGKVDLAWEKLADDMAWIFMAKASDWPFGQRMTKAEYRQRFIVESASYFPQGLRFTIKDAIAEDDRVAVEAESYGAVSNGRIYNNLYCYRMDLRNGKIQEIREYLDSGYTVEVFR